MNRAEQANECSDLVGVVVASIALVTWVQARRGAQSCGAEHNKSKKSNNEHSGFAYVLETISLKSIVFLTSRCESSYSRSAAANIYEVVLMTGEAEHSVR